VSTKSNGSVHQALRYAQELSLLGREGRMLRRQIEDQSNGLRSVLIVDDDPLMRALISVTLSPESYEVIEASDGADALDLIDAYHPSLVILNQSMPTVDGTTVCARTKQQCELQDILIVMMTAKPAVGLDGAAGADAYLCRPFSPKQLLRTIAGLLTDP